MINYKTKRRINKTKRKTKVEKPEVIEKKKRIIKT